MADLAMRAEGLVKWFGEGGAKTFAVREVSFDAFGGEMLYIEGPSGSGKTTLLSIISGILRPDSGRVIVKGKDLWSLSSDQIADFRLNTVGFVFQDYHLFPKLTTVENVAIPLVLKKLDWNESIAMALQYLEIVGIKDRAYVNPVKLSEPEQQRVAIARAIVSRPDIMIFDGPTASLDGDTGRRIVDFMKKNVLDENRCIIIVTNDSRIFEYADRIIRMEDGKIIGIDKGGSHAE